MAGEALQYVIRGGLSEGGFRSKSGTTNVDELSNSRENKTQDCEEEVKLSALKSGKNIPQPG